MNIDDLPIRNVRIVHALVADAPANFIWLAEKAQLDFSEECGRWGSRFVINFDDLPLADQSHALVRQLSAISDEKENDGFSQLWLETN